MSEQPDWRELMERQEAELERVRQARRTTKLELLAEVDALRQERDRLARTNMEQRDGYEAGREAWQDELAKALTERDALAAQCQQMRVVVEVAKTLCNTLYVDSRRVCLRRETWDALRAALAALEAQP